MKTDRNDARGIAEMMRVGHYRPVHYTYFYSLVTMDVTRKQLTNVAKPEGISGPMNTFVSLTAFPAANLKVVVRPNFDTLYSSAWLDLTKEPMIVSAPDTQGPYSAADA